MDRLAHYLDADGAAAAMRRFAEQAGVSEFAQVRNLDFTYAPFELYPLAPHAPRPLPRLAALTVDMDGTSTTTEPLALHALEYMVRRFTGRLDKAQWPGLDPVLDYPHVIGNSNFRHTEFLVGRYRDMLDRQALREAFFEALAWTLANMEDRQRRRDISDTARRCGLADLLADRDFQQFVQVGGVDDEKVAAKIEPFVRRYGAAFSCDQGSDLVAAALDVYYLRYHSILRRVERGDADALARQLLGEGGGRLIAPMPGFDVLVALVKGWLPEQTAGVFELLRAHLLAHPEYGYTTDALEPARARLAQLAAYFRCHAIKLALVTASIAYEAHTSMREVMRAAAQQVLDWPIERADRERIAERMADYRAVFDGFVCASDAWEARLKPHRDLYSIALFQMSVPTSDYACCMGLEDTEPGIIALRAAGIGCAVALPNHDTSRQNYAAASEVVRGGVPELILARNMMLAEGGSPRP